MNRHGSEHRAAARACTEIRALLERLAQRLERVAAELAELVQEEDAAVRARHLARAAAACRRRSARAAETV